MPTPYKYEKLASVSTIRLIKLERSKIDGLIACTICHTELSATEYDALSYVWGNPDANKTIRIKNTSASQWGEFKVHKNLWNFLDNAWKRKYFDRWLWTDRICLDQSHGSKELGDQIPRMAEIYRNASQVIAWLGLTDQHAQHLIAVREAVRKKTVTEETFSQHFPQATVDAITAVRDANYWKRVWVVQEVVSAKKIVTMVGDLELEWDEMPWVLGVIADNDSARGILSMMRDWTVEDDPCDLWKWLCQITSSVFESTKAHDLVYGILGLAITYGAGGKSRPHLIRKADYNEHYTFAIIDALFESFPEFCLNSESMNLLLRRLSQSSESGSEILTVFKDYINSNNTSERHKQLARFFLQICDAIFSLFDPRFLLKWPFTEEDFHKIFIMAMKGSNEPIKRVDYTQHTAILMAFTFIFGSIESEWDMVEMFEEWERTRDAECEAENLWKCCNHLLPVLRDDSDTPYSCEGQEHSGTWDLDSGPREDAVSGNASVFLPDLNPQLDQTCSSCQRSIVVLQIPEAGFRMEMYLSRDDWNGLTGENISMWLWPPEGGDDDTDGIRTSKLVVHEGRGRLFQA